MEQLISFIQNHVVTHHEPKEDCVDVAFFHVEVVNNPDKAELEKLVRDNVKGVSCDADLFNGEEHNFINLGGWIGDQGFALMLMALGAKLELWILLTPESVMPFLDDMMKKQMAGMGMVTIVKRPEEQ